jgi:protein SCO1/2
MFLRSVAWTAILLASIVVQCGVTRANQSHVLIDQRGHRFTLEALRGTPIALTFVSAHCHDACPLINAQIAQAAAAARAHLRAIRFLTLSLDPERDTRVDMMHLAREFSADPRVWIVASGERDYIRSLLKRFAVQTTRGPDGYADAHSTFVYLLDARGSVTATILPSSTFTVQLDDKVGSI